MDAPDFDTVAEALYAGEPGEFVAARTAAARDATAAGDREVADRIRALRKPTRAAFFVNRLARDGAASLTELAALGKRLREAHTNLAGADLRDLAHRRNELVRQIMADASSLSDSVSREVEETLEAVVADPAIAELALAGRLTSMAQQDADQWLSLPVAPVPQSKKDEATKDAASPKKPASKNSASKNVASSTSEPKKASSKKPASPSAERKKAEKERQARERARAQREERRRRAAATHRERAEADRTLARAEHAAEQADARVTDLRTRLADAEARATRAAKDLTAARAAFATADKAAKKAAAENQH